MDNKLIKWGLGIWVVLMAGLFAGCRLLTVN